MSSTMVDALLRFGALFVLAASVGILVIALLRPLVRRHIGAQGVLLLWWILPVALLAVALPKEVKVEMSQAPVVMWNDIAESETLAQPSDVQSVTPVVGGGDRWAPDGRFLLLAAWICGVLILAARFGLAQWRYARTIDWRHGKRGTLPAEGVPAVVGAFIPRIALPADFRTRYSAAERRLILLHELVHQRRRDGLANFCMTLLRVLLWFNPLVHWAARALGDDQESACDAAVIARHPDAIRIYAEALLRSNARVSPLPLVCHWQAYHPTVKRIAMLKQHRHALSRKRGTLLSRALLAFGALFAAAAVYALQPAREVQVIGDAGTLTTEVSAPTDALLPYIQVARAQPMKALSRQAPIQLAALTPPSGNVEILGPTAATEGNRAFYVAIDIKQDGVTLQSPSVVTNDRRALVITSGGYPGQPDIELRAVPTQQADGSIEVDVKLKLGSRETSGTQLSRTSEFKMRVMPRDRAMVKADSPTGAVLELTFQLTPVPEQAFKTGSTAIMPFPQALVCADLRKSRLPSLMALLGEDVSILSLSRDEAAGTVRLQGSAPTVSRISQLMKDVSLSPSFEKPNLLEVRNVEGRFHSFVLEFGLKCAPPPVAEQPASSAPAREIRDLYLGVNFSDAPVSTIVGALGDGSRRKVKGLEPLAGERLTLKRTNVSIDRLMQAALSCHGYALKQIDGEWHALRDATLARASDPSACVADLAPDEPKKPLMTATAVPDPNELFRVSMKLKLDSERVSTLDEQVIVGQVMKLPVQDDLSLNCSLMRFVQQLYLRCVEDKPGEPVARKAAVMAKVSVDRPGEAKVATRLGQFGLDYSATWLNARAAGTS